jgi:DNA-binding NtrC family response regulator
MDLTSPPSGRESKYLLWPWKEFVVDNEKSNDIGVLVVEDDHILAKQLVTFLTEKGYAALAACTGQGALEALKGNKIQIAIIDLKLPDIDGIALLEAIKTNHKQMIVVAASGYATIEAAAKSIKSGAYDFISKPFELVELELILRRALEKKEIKTKLRRSRIRNLVLALSLPIWALLGYYLVSFL